MKFENNEASRLTEHIMARISKHLIVINDETHHYNRVYEKIYGALSQYEKNLGGLGPIEQAVYEDVYLKAQLEDVECKRCQTMMDPVYGENSIGFHCVGCDSTYSVKLIASPDDKKKHRHLKSLLQGAIEMLKKEYVKSALVNEIVDLANKIDEEEKEHPVEYYVGAKK